MKMTCIKECKTLDGNVTMNFTLGKRYEFTRLINYDEPDDWMVTDDKGKLEVFFDPFIMFEQ